MKARSIRKAKVQETNEIIVADEVFTTQQISFSYRRQRNLKEIHFLCLECQQELKIQPSSRDRMYFSHFPNSEGCLLKTGTVSQQEMDSVVDYLGAKESYRHWFLKELIADKLRVTAGVDLASIRVDDFYINKDKETRRPDVYCKFNDLEIVFEIQLSNLSQAYILNRAKFYSKHNIFLIWILDNFDCRKPNQPFVRDLKYISLHQNYFKLDENADEFHLICDYKEVFAHLDDIRHRWKRKSIKFNDLKFDKSAYQVYYYNTRKAELDLNALWDQQRENQRKEQIEEEDRQLVSEIIDQISKSRKQNNLFLNKASQRIEILSPRQLQRLNDSFHKRPFQLEDRIFELINNRTKLNDDEFIIFFLRNGRINLDSSYKKNNICFLQAILNSTIVQQTSMIKSLFRRGYDMNDEIAFLLDSFVENGRFSKGFVAATRIANRLVDRSDVYKVFDNEKFLCSMETIHQQKIIGHNYRTLNWVQIVNLEITSRPQFWHLVYRKLVHENLLERVFREDRNGSFKSKLVEHEKANYTLDNSLDEITRSLYFV